MASKPLLPEVRRIRPDEVEQYKACRLAMLADCPDDYVDTLAEAFARPDSFWKERVERCASADSAYLAVAAIGDAFVGAMSADMRTRDLVYLTGVWVHETQRGLGVAEALYDGVEEWSRKEARASAMFLHVRASNERAQRFYARMGFVADASAIPADLRAGGCETVMVKQLA